MLKYFKGSIAKDCGEDGRGEEGDDGQEHRHTGCERERDFIVGELVILREAHPWNAY